MDESLRMLGQRIVDAARLAAAAHLQRLDMADQTLRQTEALGGAEECFSMDGELSLVNDRPRRSFFFAERRAE